MPLTPSLTAERGRLHALDGLRAAMMLLGLVLHSAASYTSTPLREAWPFQDRQTSVVFDLTVVFIHIFRMPAFFVMAGFFAALLYERGGAIAFVRHRTRRLLLPLAAAWIVVVPLVAAGFALALVQSGRRLGDLIAEHGGRFGLAHLWFLYDLYLISLFAAIAAPLATRIPDRFRGRILTAFARTIPSFTGVLILAVVSWITIVPMRVPAIETSDALLPPLRILAAYGIFFWFGWLLSGHRDRLERFRARAWRFVVGGLFATPVYLALAQRAQPGATGAHAIACAALAVTTWLLVFAAIGLFVRYFSSPRPLQRYLADGAYWIYLVHLPFTIALPGALASLDLPALVKFTIVLTGTLIATVATYHLFVRSTFLGAALNGRRFPRALPGRP